MPFPFVIWASAPMYGDRAMGGMTKELFFDILLSVHLSIILVINQRNAQILVL